MMSINTISIHLMLLFIPFSFAIFSSLRHFNTSHVTVYRQTAYGTESFPKFQYISCYCLSRIPLASSSIWLYFNTSHVTVYQNCKRCCEMRLIFQYISCYCLSVCSIITKQIFLISIHLMLLFIVFPCVNLIIFNTFQYISCYCLSIPWSPFSPCNPISIHLMLLFIMTDSLFAANYENFNTSHVTVYPQGEYDSATGN